MGRESAALAQNGSCGGIVKAGMSDRSDQRQLPGPE
jgi:hypothetical protein